MVILFTIIHVIVCSFLIGVVLLQSGGKGADIAGAFGGQGSQTTFGPRAAATLLTKLTTTAAGLFMVTSLTLAILSTRNAGSGGSILERVAPKSAPAPKKSAAPALPQNPVAPPPVQVTPAPAGQQQIQITPVPAPAAEPAKK
jgi:preprotein translocase subunit SecG